MLVFCRIWGSKQELFHMLLWLLHYMVPINNVNCRLTMPLIKVLWVCYPKIWMFKCDKSNPTTMKQVYNQSAIFVEYYTLHFDINGSWNLTQMAPVIGMEGMVSWAQPHHTQGNLMLGIYGLIKPAAFENWCHPNPHCHVIILGKISSQSEHYHCHVWSLNLYKTNWSSFLAKFH